MNVISRRSSEAIKKDLLQQKKDQCEKDLQQIMSLPKREVKELSMHCMICLADDGTCLYPNCCQGRRVMTRHALKTGRACPLPIIQKMMPSFDDSTQEAKEGNKKRSNSFHRSISSIASLRSLVNNLRSNSKSTESKTLISCLAT